MMTGKKHETLKTTNLNNVKIPLGPYYNHHDAFRHQ